MDQAPKCSVPYIRTLPQLDHGPRCPRHETRDLVNVRFVVFVFEMRFNLCFGRALHPRPHPHPQPQPQR